VDLILMNDFTTYVCFALSWMTAPEGAGFFSNLLRWVGGLVLVFFNIWVKLDAHRVVKDFAWCKFVVPSFPFISSVLGPPVFAMCVGEEGRGGFFFNSQPFVILLEEKSENMWSLLKTQNSA